MRGAKRQIRRLEEWRLHSEAQQRSGLTLSAYAREQGLNPKSFCNARKRLLRQAETPTLPLFQRVVMEPALSTASYRLHFPNGVVLEVAPGSDLRALAGLIEGYGVAR